MDKLLHDYRELIDLVKWKFRVSRNAAKKRIIELGWPEVRGVYVYNTTGYVEDYDVELRFPEDYTYHGDPRLPVALQGQQDRRVPDH